MSYVSKINNIWCHETGLRFPPNVESNASSWQLRDSIIDHFFNGLAFRASIMVGYKQAEC